MICIYKYFYIKYNLLEYLVNYFMEFFMTIQEEYFKNLSNILKINFNKKGFAFDSFSNKEEAKKFLLSQIKKDDVITFGGSTSVNQMGILEDLKDYKNFVDRNNKELKTEAEIKAFTADVYLCSANALSKNGDVIAIDGGGNRVSAMIYGPKKVYLVAWRCKKYMETLLLFFFFAEYCKYSELFRMFVANKRKIWQKSAK